MRTASTRRRRRACVHRAERRAGFHPSLTRCFAAALKAVGITDYVRPFHDLRHTAITDAAAGASALAVMAKAGHASMSTTRAYLHLAGVVFRDEARRARTAVAALAGRAFYRTFYRSQRIGGHLAAPELRGHAVLDLSGPASP